MGRGLVMRAMEGLVAALACMISDLIYVGLLGESVF